MWRRDSVSLLRGPGVGARSGLSPQPHSRVALAGAIRHHPQKPRDEGSGPRLTQHGEVLLGKQSAPRCSQCSHTEHLRAGGIWQRSKMSPSGGASARQPFRNGRGICEHKAQQLPREPVSPGNAEMVPKPLLPPPNSYL